jgi:hypothetical protein
MAITERRTQEPVVEPRYHSVNRPEELTHIVCCRDHSWSHALCGAETEYINLGASFVCTMCVEVYRDLLSAFPQPTPDDTCPIDGRPCPDDDAYAELLRRRLGP